MSILSPRWAWNLDNPVFELSDELKDLTYWVTEIPTPQQATVLLEEHGGHPGKSGATLTKTLTST